MTSANIRRTLLATGLLLATGPAFAQGTSQATSPAASEAAAPVGPASHPLVATPLVATPAHPGGSVHAGGHKGGAAAEKPATTAAAKPAAIAGSAPVHTN